jgi:hypothetical protein
LRFIEVTFRRWRPPLFDLEIPQAASGTKFTVRVRPFGGGGFVQAVLEVR